MNLIIVNSPSIHIFFYIYNETSNIWTDGQHWDDGGDCSGLHQEEFTIYNVSIGYGQLFLSVTKKVYIKQHLHAIMTMEPTKDPAQEPMIVLEPTPDSIRNTTTPIIVSKGYKHGLALKFVCRSINDLSDTDWKALIINGLINAFNVDVNQHETFIVNTKIDGTLFFLENQDEALVIKDNYGHSRHLLDNEDAPYFYNIEVNITMDEQYLIGNEKSVDYLCEDQFANDFKDGVSNDINKIQITRSDRVINLH